MKILVLMKMVPDIVEELEVASDGTSLDREYLRFIVNERDDYALEQALLLKDRLQADVTVVAPEARAVARWVVAGTCAPVESDGGGPAGAGG